MLVGFVRRLAIALGLAALAASGIRLGGGAQTPSQRGGWQPFDLDDDLDDGSTSDIDSSDIDSRSHAGTRRSASVTANDPVAHT